MFILSIIGIVIVIVLVALALLTRLTDKDREEGYTSSPSKWFWLAAIVVAVISFIFWLLSMYVQVDPGEAKVMKDWTGNVDQTPITTTGAHWKEPWVDAIDFNTKNQLAVFLGDGNQSYNGSPTNGPQITFTDKDGVTGNMDLVVLYSIKADNVVGLVEDYTTQEDFQTKVIEQDIRSVPRDIPGQYTTIQMMTDRVAVAGKIRTALEAEWKDKGVVIEDVSLQEVRYSDAVKARFEEAQNAQTAIVTARAAAEQAQIAADSAASVKVKEATAEAEANKILASSLTENVLRSRWIEAIAGSQRIIVPQDFTSLGNLQ